MSVETWNLEEMFGLPAGKKEESQKDQPVKSKTEVLISDLIPFKDHPFRLYEGERLNDMVESIKEHGIITPIVLRRLDDGTLQILSGHNRVNAAQVAGIKQINKDKFIILEGVTDEEAMLIVTETNLIQRSFAELSHSEKARILTERHKAIKEQGKRMDIINEIEMMSNIDGYEENSTSYQFDKKLESNEKLGEKYDLSPANVSRYLRIDMLIDQLKARLDENEIPFMAGVDLSFLKGEQQEVIESLLGEGYKMDLKKAAALKTLARGNFNPSKAEDILSGKKTKKKRNPRFTAKFTKSIINQYVTEERTIKDVEAIIQQLLEDYFTKKEPKI